MGAIDPTAVKAGDTVTLERGTALVRDVVTKVAPHGTNFRFTTENNPDPLHLGVFYIVGNGAWTLTAHQPAPKPEPEWKPGTTGTATVRGVEGVEGAFIDRGTGLQFVSFVQVGLPYATQSIFGAADVTAFVPDETRPLPTVDEMVSALEFAGDDGLHVREHAEAMLKYLAGESR